MVESSNLNKNFGIKSFPSKLLSGNGNTEVETSIALENEIIGFYFCTHSFNPCKEFTKILVDAYKEWKLEEKKIEIILVSCDKDEKSFEETYSAMPWLAVPWNSLNCKEFKDRLFVKGVPTLDIRHKSGKSIDACGTYIVTHNNSNAFDIWIKRFNKELSSKK